MRNKRKREEWGRNTDMLKVAYRRCHNDVSSPRSDNPWGLLMRRPILGDLSASEPFFPVRRSLSVLAPAY